MNACASVGTALCGRLRTPSTTAALNAAATLSSFPRAIDPDGGGKLVAAVNARSTGGFYYPANCVFRPTAQTPQLVCRSSWQLEDSMFYSKKVHEHFFNPRNAGAFDLSDPETRKKVGTAVVGKAACGDVIKLQVMVEEGKIKDARFKTFGCGSAIASSSYATELIKGKSCEAALQLKNTDIAEYLNLPPVKVHCSLLAEDAVRHAIKDYQKKQASLLKTSDTAVPREEAGTLSASPSSTSEATTAGAVRSAVSAAAAVLEQESTTATAAASQP